MKYETPVHKIELYVVELGVQYGLDGIKTMIDNSLDGCAVHFGTCKTKEAGEWSDEHKLNYNRKPAWLNKYFEKLK